jgi:hypothetical protein
MVLKHVRFEASPAGQAVVQAYDWLRDNIHGAKPAKDLPQEVLTNAWQRYVFRKDSGVNIHAFLHARSVGHRLAPSRCVHQAQLALC